MEVEVKKQLDMVLNQLINGVNQQFMNNQKMILMKKKKYMIREKARKY
jgi:hypothetical protein